MTIFPFTFYKVVHWCDSRNISRQVLFDILCSQFLNHFGILLPFDVDAEGTFLEVLGASSGFLLAVAL